MTKLGKRLRGSPPALVAIGVMAAIILAIGAVAMVRAPRRQVLGGLPRPAVTLGLEGSPSPLPTAGIGADGRPPLPPGSPPVHLESVAFGTPSDGWGVGSTPGGDDIAVTRSGDGGRTWSAPRVVSAAFPAGTAGGGYTVRFADAVHGWIYGPGAAQTDDGGVTWRGTGLPGAVREIAPVGKEVWAAVQTCPPYRPDQSPSPGCGAALYRAPVGGRTWARMRSVPFDGSRLPVISLVRVSAATALVSLSGLREIAELYRTDDGGATWQHLAKPCSGQVDYLDLAAVDGRTLWVVCGSVWGVGNADKSVYLSGDGGASWNLRARAGVNPETGILDVGGYPLSLRLTGSRAGFMGVGGAAGGGMASRDGGRTWARITGFDGDSISFWFVDPVHGWALGGWALYGTSDGGKTWAKLVPLP